MKECYIAVDESGSFGRFDRHSPYYLVTLVFHNQTHDLTGDIQRLDEAMAQFGLQNHAIHTAPLIRREGDYINLPTITRKQIFNRLFYFARNVPFTYRTVIVDKRQLSDPVLLNEWIARRLAAFFSEQLVTLTAFDKLVVCYDNGQMELNSILTSAFCKAFNCVEFRRTLPVNYRIAQVADLLCALELLALKAENKALTRSELAFFSSQRDLYRHYIDHLRKKRI